MFIVGDKVQDTDTGQVGEVVKVNAELGEWPIVADFGDGRRAYDISGFYNRRLSERRIELINPRPQEANPVIVEITQTFIQVKEDDIFVLLPLASTSFKIKHDIIVATHNNKEYTIYTSDVSQIKNQLLNPTRKELL